jgi:carboxymethylenebutenolidase
MMSYSRPESRLRPPVFPLSLLLTTLAACAPADDHAAHAVASGASGGAPPAAATRFDYPDRADLPAGADRAQSAIDRSPRHGEWVSVADPGGPTVKAWVVYPERRDKAPVVMVIHTIGGLAVWARALADQLAEDGFIAVAPDFLSGHGPGGGGTESFASTDDVRKAMSAVTPDEVARRLDAVRAYALMIPAASGRIATMGFCWGGSRSFEYALHQPGLDAAIVFYGGAPQDPAGFSRIAAPILGLYGGDDARVNATIGPAEAELKRLGRTFEYEIYEGAGHGFVGAQADREGANFRATERAWPKALAFLRARLGDSKRSTD